MRTRLGRVLTGLGAALLLNSLAACSHRGDPDPDGRILVALQSIGVAVPDEADVYLRHDVPAEWDSCDGRPETEGWNDIQVRIQFRWDQPPEALVEFADGRMEAAGWVDDGEISSPLGPGLRWTRTLADGTVARASLSPGTVDGTSVYWSLDAIAPPHGQRVSGC